MSSEGPRTAVVTGSSSGIGLAIAQDLLANGWSVIGLDRSGAAIDAPRFEAIQVDLGDPAAIEAIAPAITGAQALVHAAGVLRVGAVGGLDAQAGDLMWRIHVQAASVLANAMVPAMARRGNGRVVFLGSRVSGGMPGRGQYAGTKAALVAMARSWAAEVASQGVTINVVSPAATKTRMLEDPARTASAPRLPPIGRLIEPSEIASMVGYLLSPQAAAITGQEIVICGGSSLNT